MAELLGTFFILLMGDGVVAMVKLFNLGDYTTITFAWGLGVFLGILVSNRITGAHLNPAVTLALAATKRFPWKKMPHYVLGQMVGSFLGALVVYVFYQAKFGIVDPNLENSAGIFATFPAVPGFWPGFLSEVIATAVLLFGILAIVEHFSEEKAGWLAPFGVAALIVAIGMAMGGMHGYALNPARDFSPRLFIALMGFKNNGLSDGSMIWIVGVLGPLVGGPIGAFLYGMTVGRKPSFYKTDPTPVK